MESSQQQNLITADPTVTTPLDPSRPIQTAQASGVTRKDTPAPLAPGGLSFGDGFQFGCGFFVAGLLAMILVLLLLLLSLLLLSLTGVSLFGNLLGTAPAPF